MALFEHDIETGRKGLTGRGAQAFNAVLPTSLLGGKFQSSASKDKDAFSGRVLKGLMTGNQGLFKTNEKMVKNTTMMTGFAKADLRLQASTNQFTQRGFKLSKDNITRTAKFYKEDEKIRKEEKFYYKTEKKQRKDDMRRQRRLDADEKRWRDTMLKLTKENTANTETTQRFTRISAGAKGVGAIAKIIGGPAALLGVALRASSGFMNRNSQQMGALSGAMRQLSVALGRRGSDLSYEMRYGAGSTDAAQESRQRQRLESDSRRELEARGFSRDQINRMRSDTGLSSAELAQDRSLDQRTRSQRLRDRFSPGNVFNRRGAIAGAAGAARTAGRVGAMPFRAAGAAARGAGAVAGMGAKFLPGVGLAVEGARAIQSAKKGDFFGAAVAGAGGLASIMPGLGPIVAIALESIAMMVPEGIKDAFNKWAGPIFGKMMKDIGGGKGVGGDIGKIFSNFGDAMESVWRIIKATLLHPSAINFYKALGVAFVKYGKFLALGIKGLFGFIADIVEGEKGLFGALWDNFRPVFKSAFMELAPAMTKLLGSLVKLAWAAIKGGIIATLGWIPVIGPSITKFLSGGTSRASVSVPGTYMDRSHAATTSMASAEKRLEDAKAIQKMQGVDPKIAAANVQAAQDDLADKRTRKQQATVRARKAMQEHEGLLRVFGSDPEEMARVQGWYSKRESFRRKMQERPDEAAWKHNFQVFDNYIKGFEQSVKDHKGLDHGSIIAAVKKGALPDTTQAYGKHKKPTAPDPPPVQPSTSVSPLRGGPDAASRFAFIAGETVRMESSGRIGAVNRGDYLNQPTFKGAFGKYQFAERANGPMGKIDTMSRYINWLSKHPNSEYQFLGKELARHPISSDPGSPFMQTWQGIMGGNMLGAFETSQDIFAKRNYWDNVAGQVKQGTRSKFDINTLDPAVQSAIFATSIGAGAGTATRVLLGFGDNLPNAPASEIIAALVNKRMERSHGAEKKNLQNASKRWQQWAATGIAPAGATAATSGGGGFNMNSAAAAAAGLYSSLMTNAGNPKSGVGGVGAIMGSIGRAIVTKGAAALAAGKDAVQALGLPPNLMGGSAGAIARAVTGAVGAASGEMGRMSDAMSKTFASDPNLQKLGRDINSMTAHTGAMANAQNPEKVQIDPKDNGLINLLGPLGAKAI